LGVVPFLRHLELDQEDSVVIERFRMTPFEAETVNIAVVLLPHMSNFTDFNQLGAEPDVALRYVSNWKDIHGADVVILPGSKTTIADLDYLKGREFDRALRGHWQRGGELVGICGGFQMLGYEVIDPHGVETGGAGKGFGLLNISTELLWKKQTIQVTARPLFWGDTKDCVVDGYEIHMGQTTSSAGIVPCFEIIRCAETFSSHQPVLSSKKEHHQEVRKANRLDGAMGPDGMVWGTYIHGVFDRPAFRRAWLNRVRARKQLPALAVEVSRAVTSRLDQALDRWADHVGAHLNLEPIYSMIELPKTPVPPVSGQG
jgi:adenosylcobyric acid synthase